MTRPYTQKHLTILSVSVELVVCILLAVNFLYSQEVLDTQILNGATVIAFFLGFLLSLLKCGITFRRNSPNLFYASICERIDELKRAHVIPVTLVSMNDTVGKEIDESGPAI